MFVVPHSPRSRISHTSPRRAACRVARRIFVAPRSTILLYKYGARRDVCEASGVECDIMSPVCMLFVECHCTHWGPESRRIFSFALLCRATARKHCLLRLLACCTGFPSFTHTHTTASQSKGLTNRARCVRWHCSDSKRAFRAAALLRCAAHCAAALLPRCCAAVRSALSATCAHAAAHGARVT